VVEVDVGEGVAPAALLAAAKSIERDMGRVAGGDRWGPRPIDIDLLFFGNTIIGGTEEGDASPVVPHPRIVDRRFVLQPLADLAPSFVHPVLERSVSALLGACADAPLLGGPCTLPRTVGVRLLPHGGDLALRVRGSSPAELVRRGCHGLVSAIVARDRLREEDRREAAFELPDGDARPSRSGFAELLVDVLNEILVWLDADAWLPARVAVRIEDRRVVVAAFGAAIRGRELPFERAPKAVTRHELRVVRRAGGWSAHVVIDL
jgi:SHS2 domain-containing protein